jgi:hypothetical protein
MNTVSALSAVVHRRQSSSRRLGTRPEANEGGEHDIALDSLNTEAVRFGGPPLSHLGPHCLPSGGVIASPWEVLEVASATLGAGASGDVVGDRLGPVNEASVGSHGTAEGPDRLAGAARPAHDP